MNRKGVAFAFSRIAKLILLIAVLFAVGMLYVILTGKGEFLLGIFGKVW